MRRSGVIAAVLAAGLVVPSAAAADNIRVQSTTDTKDAGLVDDILVSAYAAAQPGDTLTYTAVGTGLALNNARAGLGDVVITHAPTLEAKFVADGYSLGLGRQIFYSDYVIVGPADDPAQVSAKHPHDAIGAFEDIAAAGTANPNTVRFTSRFDDSGTNVQEQLMWAASNVTPKQTATKPNPPDPTRQEPGTGGAGGYPAWYLPSQRGQAANLTATENCVVAGNGCYTIIDRGTYNRAVNGGSVTHLKIVSQKNSADARGGENLLINPFSVYIVNPDKITTSPKPNVAAAQRFVDFLVSAGFQTTLQSYPNALDPAFLPDAFPAITLDGGLPQTVAKGTVVSLSGRAANRLPGAAAVNGMPVVLQQSSDNGTTWLNANATVQTGADGRFTVSAPVQATVRFRLFTGASPATSYSEFTPSTQDLGVVTVSATPLPIPTVDKTKPVVSRVVLGRTAITLRLSEKGTVKAIIERRVRSGKKVSYRKVQTVTLKSTSSRAKTLRVKHKKLAPGKYRVRLTAVDAAGNKQSLTRNTSVR